ncbi:MAG: hypothetical protein R8K48_07490 [Gallionella sp.]
MTYIPRTINWHAEFDHLNEQPLRRLMVAHRNLMTVDTLRHLRAANDYFKDDGQ